MEELPLVLQRLNIPEDGVGLVQGRVERRLANNAPQQWCGKFRDRAEKLLLAQIFSGEYGEHYQALRNLLSAQGIVNFAGEHGLEVPETEREIRPPKVIRTSSADDAQPDLESPTPAHCESIRGMTVQRSDGSWVLECGIPRGERAQIAIVAEGGVEHAFERPIQPSENVRLDLDLPDGCRPTTVVIVVLNELNEEVGRGIIGEQIS